MLVPLRWLQTYVDLPASPAELIERLTLAGLETSGFRSIGFASPPGVRVKPEDAGLDWDREKIVLAKVIKIEQHPNADKLKLVTLDYGGAETKTVVTGAPNIAPGQSGMKVVLGLQGSKYFYEDKDGKKATFTLEPKALRGIMNDAMCMSNYELGIAEDHDGIILLDGADPAPGTPIQDVLGEQILELDILPNMARCLSLLGIAREVAAITGAKVREPNLDHPVSAESSAGQFEVRIENPALCPRYSATILKSVTIGPAPRWLRSRMQYAGMRPISNAVDITNCAMLEYGQPLHAFDFDVLKERAGGKIPIITVRSARAGEKLVTLDRVERTLAPEHLVIADERGPIALAGVMGGLETEVTDATKTILLESASFDAVSVRKCARQFNLFSEASTRFSRGVHPEVVPLAAKRAAQMFAELAGAEVLNGVVEAYPAPLPPRKIELNRNEIERLLGITIPDAEVERILLALDFQLHPTLWGWTVTAPPTRLDLQSGPADLIEELARIAGYDRLPMRLLPLEMPVPVGNPSLEIEERMKDALVDLGLNECITYSLTSPTLEAALRPETEFVKLLNPGSPERSVLRRSLLPGLLEVASRNLKTPDRVELFELGVVFHPIAGSLPEESRRLSLVLSGRRSEPAWDTPAGSDVAGFDFYDLKGVLETALAALHLPALRFAAPSGVLYLHPGRSAELRCGEVVLGVLGELHPKVAAAFDLGEKSILVAELDFDAIQKAVPNRIAYSPFSTLPAAKRDLAIIVPEELRAEKVLSEIRVAGGTMLCEANLFDVYRGESIPPGTKSLAYALQYSSMEKTLSDKEIDKAHEKIEGRLRHVLQAKIRGKDGA